MGSSKRSHSTMTMQEGDEGGMMNGGGGGGKMNRMNGNQRMEEIRDMFTGSPSNSKISRNRARSTTMSTSHSHGTSTFREMDSPLRPLPNGSQVVMLPQHPHGGHSQQSTPLPVYHYQNFQHQQQQQQQQQMPMQPQVQMQMGGYGNGQMMHFGGGGEMRYQVIDENGNAVGFMGPNGLERNDEEDEDEGEEDGSRGMLFTHNDGNGHMQMQGGQGMVYPQQQGRMVSNSQQGNVYANGQMMDTRSLTPTPPNMHQTPMATGPHPNQMQQQGHNHIVRPTPVRSKSLRAPPTYNNNHLHPNPNQQHGGHPGLFRANSVIDPRGGMLRQGSWNGEPILQSDINVFAYPTRPHSAHPMETPLARYGQVGAGSGQMMGQPQFMVANGGGNGNQDPFVGGSNGNVIYRNGNQIGTMNTDELMLQNGGGGNGMIPYGHAQQIGRPSSAFGGPIMQGNEEDDYDDYEEEDASNPSPQYKMGSQKQNAAGSQPMRPLPGSVAMRAMSPTVMTARSMTPYSESSYQPSVASVQRKQAVVVQPNAGIEEEEEEEEEDDEEEDEDDEDEDEEGEFDGDGNGRSSRMNQGSPTKSGKGKKGKQNLLGSKKGSKKGKGDIKSRDAGRKQPNGLNTKASAEKDKPYVPENLPPPPRSSEKPSWSYAALIGQAILGSSKKRLALNQIYAWISAAYPYFKPGESGWMNSIRHNLSLNDCFMKQERGPGDKGGKGSVWLVDPNLEFQFKDGGFKKQPKARASTGPDGEGGGGVPSTSKGKKRKAGEEMKRQSSGEQTGTPLLQATPIAVGAGQQPTMQMGLEGSPIPADAPMANKRPKLEKANTWTTPSNPISRPGSGMGYRRDSGYASMGNISMEGGDAMADVAHEIHEMYIQEANMPNDGSPEGTMQIERATMNPTSLMARVTQNNPQIQFNADDYTTPNRPLSANPLHRHHILSSAMMPPHLTPSASSPVSSSPFPSTMMKPNGVDRRMGMQSRYEMDNVQIRGEDDNHSSDQEAPDSIRKPLSGLQPSAQLGGPFVAPALPQKMQRPKTSPLDTTLANSASSEHSSTLSPIVEKTRGHRSTVSVNLPGPGDLLNSSPRPAERHPASGDILGHLDKLPRSPVALSFPGGRGANGNGNAEFATPLNPALARHRSNGFTPRSTALNQMTTPLRGGGPFIPHETPIGNIKLQFKAEHRLLDSPMGLSGSCYDDTCHSYQVDWELDQLQQRGIGLGSPTSAGFGVGNGCKRERAEGEGVARTLFEVESMPFSDP